VDPSKTWAEFDFKLPDMCMEIFDSTTSYTLGNRECARFYKDMWLDGERVEHITPNL
jgi:hypothetical protein